MSQSSAVLITVAIIGGLILFAAVVALIAYKVITVRNSRRSAALSAQAARAGLTFRETPDRELLRPYERIFSLFSQGDRLHEFRNLMEGVLDEHHALVFDYGYTKYVGRSSQNTYHTVAVFDLNEKQVPTFQLRSKHLMDRIRDAGGFHDIDVNDNEEFSANCWLTGEDEDTVGAIFRPDLTGLFADGAGLRQTGIEGSGKQLMYYHIGHVSPEDFPQFLDGSAKVCRMFDSA